jgi:hypothetical protein
MREYLLEVPYRNLYFLATFIVIWMLNVLCSSFERDLFHSVRR